jgi:hemerythrin
MIIEWKSSFSSGHPLIDSDHRMVIDLLNELDVALAVVAPPEVITTALRTLERRIDEHFQREELHFHALPQDDAQHHSTEHADLRNRIAVLLDDWQNGSGAQLDRSQLLSLAHWWTAHITGADTRLAAALVQTAL